MHQKRFVRRKLFNIHTKLCEQLRVLRMFEWLQYPIDLYSQRVNQTMSVLLSDRSQFPTRFQLHCWLELQHNQLSHRILDGGLHMLNHLVGLVELPIGDVLRPRVHLKRGKLLNLDDRLNSISSWLQERRVILQTRIYSLNGTHLQWYL